MPEPGNLTLRYAFPDDYATLARLAALDSAEPLAEPVLIAEVDGEAVAAMSLSDGRVVADPFRRTVPLVALLQARAAQLIGPNGTSGRLARTRARLRLVTP
jgi:hypothetical protein